MDGSFDLAAYLVLLLVSLTGAGVDENNNFPYTDLFPELLIQPSGLDLADADSDEMHELRCADCKAIPKLATVSDDDELLFRSTALQPIIPRTNVSRADRGLRQSTIIKKRGGLPRSSYTSDFDKTETDVMMIPVVNRVRKNTAERTTSSVAAPNRVFDFRWNDLIKKTAQKPQ